MSDERNNPENQSVEPLARIGRLIPAWAIGPTEFTNSRPPAAPPRVLSRTVASNKKNNAALKPRHRPGFLVFAPLRSRRGRRAACHAARRAGRCLSRFRMAHFSTPGTHIMFTRKALVFAVASAVVGLATFVSTDADARPGDSSQITKQGSANNRARPSLQHRPQRPRPAQNRVQSRSHVPTSFCARFPQHPSCRGGGAQTSGQQGTSFCERFPTHPRCRGGKQTSGQQGTSFCERFPTHPSCRGGGKQTSGQQGTSFCKRFPSHPQCRGGGSAGY